MSDVNAVHDGEDAPLLDLLDALVGDRGRTAAARALGVNYRTMLNCHDSRRVTRRMRKALTEFRDARDVGDDGGSIVDGDGTGETQEKRSAVLEEENRALRETIHAQAEELDTLRRRVAALEDRDQPLGGSDAVDGRQGQPGEWRPPRRGHELPDAGVVTVEEQPDEEHAFGPAAPLVAEWRELRTADQESGGRVDRARAAVRRWELEAEMLRDWHLTLPPDSEPLDESTRSGQLRRRELALAEERRELSRAKRGRLLRRVATLGFWR